MSARANVHTVCRAKGVRGMAGAKKRRRMPLAGAALLASVLTTETLLLMEGRYAEALPLHLCGLSALAALAVCAGARGVLLDFLWYLGLPGALLALAFPAPALCRHPALLGAAYVSTHALIAAVPLVLLARGERPRRGRARRMMLLLQGIALAAFFVNRALGTDFLFLSTPPAGSPLVAVFHRSYALYLCALQAMMLLVCLGMGAALRAADA